MHCSTKEQAQMGLEDPLRLSQLSVYSTSPPLSCIPISVN
jgi:hypothetical protein